MVLDFRKFTTGSNPNAGFLTVLEEVPGYIHFEDMTEHLIVRTSAFLFFLFFSGRCDVFVQFALCFKSDLRTYCLYIQH